MLAATAARLREIVTAHGGDVLTATEAVSARRTPDGDWRTTLSGPNGRHDVTSRSLVVATGGYQTDAQMAEKMVAGARLGALAGIA